MDLLNALEYISPSELDYQDWVNVGMALKQAVERVGYRKDDGCFEPYARGRPDMGDRPV